MYCAASTCWVSLESGSSLNRTSVLRIMPPIPVTPFITAMKAACPAARWNGTAWVVPAAEAASALALVYAYFAVVRNETTLPVPPFCDDPAVTDPSQITAWMELLTPALPALHALLDGNTISYHAALPQLEHLAATEPTLLLRLGVIPLYRSYLPFEIGAPARRFWIQLWRDRAAFVESESLPDGSIRETIRLAAAHAVWGRMRQQVLGAPPAQQGSGWYPPQAWAPVWIAALLASINAASGTRPFTFDPAAGAFTRLLPPWPLRVPASTVMRTEVREIVHAIVSAAVLPGHAHPDGKDLILHLSAVGHLARLRALWAAFMHGKREGFKLLLDRQIWTAYRAEGRNQYVVDWNDAPLTQSGYAHLAITHRSLVAPQLGESFFHLTGNDFHPAPDLALFAQQLNRAISIPFDEAWVPVLWRFGRIPEAGEREPLIRVLPSVGCTGYWVDADERRWRRLILAAQQGRHPDAIRLDDVPVTEVGLRTEAVAGLVEYAGEGDMEDPDDGDDA